MPDAFHKLSFAAQAALVLDTSYFGITDADRGEVRSARVCMNALDDMAVEAFIGTADPEAAQRLSRKATSAAAAIRARLQARDLVSMGFLAGDAR